MEPSNYESQNALNGGLVTTRNGSGRDLSWVTGGGLSEERHLKIWQRKSCQAKSWGKEHPSHDLRAGRDINTRQFTPWFIEMSRNAGDSPKHTQINQLPSVDLISEYWIKADKETAGSWDTQPDKVGPSLHSAPSSVGSSVRLGLSSHLFTCLKPVEFPKVY